MNKTKILYVITQSEMGGAQRYLYDLATNRLKNGHDVEVAIGKDKGKDLKHKLIEKGIKVTEIKHLARAISPLHDLLSILELRKLYKAIKPATIHLNSTKAGILGSLASTGLKTRVIYTAHGWVFNEPLGVLKKTIYKLTEKFTARFKDVIICVSEFDRQTALSNKIAKEDKLVTIHNGLDPKDINLLTQEESKKELNLPEGQIIVGTVANFYPTKGLEYFIGAINILVNKWGLPVTGIVIGDGKLRDKLNNLSANYSLNGHLLLPGKKDKSAKYLKAFDIYTCSSVKEGFPYSILEAMAAEVPIVSTGVGGIPEMIDSGKEGLLVKPKDELALATSIKELIDKKEYSEKLAKAAKEKLAAEFSKKKMIEKTFSLY